MNTKMYHLIQFVIILLLFHSCGCKHCTDNLSAEVNKIPYKDGELVAFVNDTLGINYDTVHCPYTKNWNENTSTCPSSGDTYNNQCSVFMYFFYSCNFYAQIVQSHNANKNIISFNISYVQGAKTEKVKYVFKNESLNAYHYYYPIDSNGSWIWKHTNFKNRDSSYIYNDYYYTIDKTIKLLQYTRVYKDGKRRVFRLKE